MSDELKNGGAAFPGLHPSKECNYSDSGMTLRDYFAAKAMKLFKGGHFDEDHHDHVYHFAAQRAYKFADAMIKVRDEKL